MNISRIITLGIAIFYMSFMLISCGSEEMEHTEVHDHSNPDHHKDGQSHDHGHDNGHDHDNGDANKSSYYIDFSSDPDVLVAGSSSTLSFAPKKEGEENAVVPLEMHHEKKMHLMIVSTDLAYFEHIHPKYNGKEYQINVLGTDQSFTNGPGLNETRFVEGGDYIMFVDYVPSGGTGQLDRLPLTVSGSERAITPLGSRRSVWEGDGYRVELGADKVLAVNKSIKLSLHITLNDQPVTDLDNYLGALAHMVVLSEDTEDYLHVHPMKSKAHGPDVMLHTKFPKAGKYKVFMQFNHNDVVRTADFVVEIKG